MLDIDSVEAAVIGPGVTRRLLWDSPTHRVTVIDMEPGATFPYVDTHDTLEETYVVSGQWSEGDRSYGPGAFLHYEAGTSHQPPATHGRQALRLPTQELKGRRPLTRMHSASGRRAVSLQFPVSPPSSDLRGSADA